MRFPDARTLVLLDGDGALAFYGVRDGKLHRRIAVEGARIEQVWPTRGGWSGVARRFATPGGELDRPLFVVRVDRTLSKVKRGVELGEVQVWPDPIAPEKQAFVLEGDDQVARVRLSDGKRLATAIVADARDLASSPDGKLLCVVSGERGEFVFLDANTLKERGRDEQGWAAHASFAPDGKRIALVTGDAVVVRPVATLLR